MVSIMKKKSCYVKTEKTKTKSETIIQLNDFNL